MTREPSDRGLVHHRAGAGAARARGARRADRVLPAAREGLLPQPRLRRRGVRGAPSCPAAARSGPTPTRSTSRRRRTSRATDPYEPFALAAVELPEGIVVLGQVADGYGVDDLHGRRRGRAGRRAALHRRRRRAHDLALEAGRRAGRGGRPVSARRRRPRGRHAPVGQVGPHLRRVRRARGPRRARRRRRRLAATSTSSSAARPCATATPATSPAPPSPRRSAGTAPASPRRTPPAPPAPRRSTPRGPGSSPGCATSRWSSAPTPRPRASSRRTRGSGGTTPTGCGSGCSARPTRRTSRSTPAAGWTSTARPPRTSPQVKVKNARHGLDEPQRPLPQGGHAPRTCWPRAVVADPLHLLDICATSDGAAAVVLTSDGLRPAARHRPTRCGSRAISTVTPTFPNTVIDMPNFATDSRAAVAAPERTFKDSIAARGLRGGRHRPRGRRASPRSTTCPPRSSSTGTRTSACASRGEAEQLLRAGDTTIGGRIPVNPSGGLACFGEAVPGAGARPGVRGDLAAARPGRRAARSRAPGSASPPTRACSATAPRSC